MIEAKRAKRVMLVRYVRKKLMVMEKVRASEEDTSKRVRRHQKSVDASKLRCEAKRGEYRIYIIKLMVTEKIASERDPPIYLCENNCKNERGDGVSCRSQQALSNYADVHAIGVDTAENAAAKTCSSVGLQLTGVPYTRTARLRTGMSRTKEADGSDEQSVWRPGRAHHLCAVGEAGSV